MPQWEPTQDLFAEEDVYVIGGGASLHSFPWSLLRGRATVGCNDAYKLGPEFCNICIFGDRKWFDAHRNELQWYVDAGGLVVTNQESLKSNETPWLKWMPKAPNGLHKDALGWGCNTGVPAVNLALLLGAKRVFLLGFDMQLTQGENNWHPNGLDKPTAEVYGKFLCGFHYVKDSLPLVFPGCEIINVTDDSKLMVFPKVSLRDHFGDNYGKIPS